MEMPEGYNRLEKMADLLSPDSIIWISIADKNRMLELIKEMANAIDEVVNHQVFVGELLEETKDRCESVLKKFEEWK